MDRRACQATVHGITRVRHDLGTKERERVGWGAVGYQGAKKAEFISRTFLQPQMEKQRCFGIKINP